MTQLSSFRKDINGLRAYAVILVVLFHFKILGFDGGFIGVDIFFVISGYLMTKIITEQIIQNKFSIWKFYLARGIRILPALLVLTSVVAIAGCFLLIPEDYRTYAKHALTSITFISNILYWNESSDYFSAAAHDKILLHTWSLSVEWQFYIILPIILLVLAKIKNSKKILNLAIFIGFLISLILSYKVTQTNQTTAFYMIPTRAWEMLAGGIVYACFSQLILSNKFKNIIEIIGFGLLFISLLIFDEKTLWPGINAILPVMGAMLILISNNNSIFTNASLLQWIGNASYSIYLWHWPIVFFIGYYGISDSYLIISFGILLSVFLGWLSYKFIETPTRIYLSNITMMKSYLVILVITGILVCIYYFIVVKDGLHQRASESFLKDTKEIVMPLPQHGWCFYSVDSIHSLPIGSQVLDCKIGANTNIKHNALLFGDSFAGHNIPFWNDIGVELNTQVTAVTTNWCYPSLNDDYTGLKTSRAYDQCKFNRKYLAENMHKYDYLIFAGHWKQIKSKDQLQNLDTLLKQANKLNIPIFIMAAPYAFDKNIGNAYKAKVWINQPFDLSHYSNDEYDKVTRIANKEILEISSAYKNVFYIPRSALYSEKNLTHSGAPYSLDGGHISIIGSHGSADFFKKSNEFSTLKKIID